MTVNQTVLLHGGDALWILFVPGAVIAILLCVSGVALTLRGLASLGEQSLTLTTHATEARDGGEPADRRLPEAPTTEKGRLELRIGVVLLSLAALFSHGAIT